MFVYNVKLNSKSILKILLVVMALIITFFFMFSIYKIVSESFKVKDQVNCSDVSVLTPENYTNILKSVHDNPDDYYRKKN